MTVPDISKIDSSFFRRCEHKLCFFFFPQEFQAFVQKKSLHKVSIFHLKLETDLLTSCQENSREFYSRILSQLLLGKPEESPFMLESLQAH